MSDRVEFKLDLTGVMSKFNKSMVTKIQKGMAAAGPEAETKAKRSAPVDTGRLKDSIHHRVAPDATWMEIYTNVEYAPVQEFGDDEKNGKYFMRKGLKAGRLKLQEVMKAKKDFKAEVIRG